MNAIYNSTSVENIILIVLAIVIILVILGSLYTFIRAIFFFIFGGNQEESKKKGRNSIRYMIIGIILTLVLLFVFPYLLKAMKVPGSDTYTPKNIFNKAGDIVGGAFELGDFIKESQQENEFRGNMYYDDASDAGTVDTMQINDYSL